MATPAIPNFSDDIIIINSSHNITLGVTLTVDQVVFASGEILSVSGATVALNDGFGKDLDVSGTLNYANRDILGNGSISLNDFSKVKLDKRIF